MPAVKLIHYDLEQEEITQCTRCPSPFVPMTTIQSRDVNERVSLCLAQKTKG